MTDKVSGRMTGVVLTVLALVVAVLWFADWRSDRTDAGRDAAAATAVTSMKAILTFKPSTVAEEIKAERKLVTGKFADELAKSDLATGALKNKVTATAEIARAGVESSSGNEVVVLMFANVTRSTPGSKDTKVAGSRMRVTMKKVDGDWKISDYKSL